MTEFSGIVCRRWREKVGINQFDDIAIISEKITVKPKKKVVVVRGPGPGKGRGVTKVAPKSSPAARKLPSNLVKVGGSKPVQARPVAPAAAPKKPTKTAFDDSDEEEDLTCKMCQSSFWFKSQLVEHLTNTHNVENPEKYFRKQYLQSNMTSWFNLDIPIQTIMDQFL